MDSKRFGPRFYGDPGATAVLSTLRSPPQLLLTLDPNTILGIESLQPTSLQPKGSPVGKRGVKSFCNMSATLGQPQAAKFSLFELLRIVHVTLSLSSDSSACALFHNLHNCQGQFATKFTRENNTTQ